ncbi:usp6 n-terminal like [Vairimorpha apis BRL 01]|uniref:Usp6 n-terminal like n=1 Tax=Vairimorpha apis BRL 01 TaxID=1037528 RepID=T0LBS3_9MICR|nr:usp6 n-terminal like [Vairimorpha apis BRL 01]
MNNDQEIMNKYNKDTVNENIICTNEYGFLTDKFVTFPNIFFNNLKNKWYIIIEKYKTDTKKYKKNLKVHRLVSYGIPIPLKYTTFRNHFLFCKSYGRGQSELFNILLAFSNFMPNIGYCQGMSNFAAILLMYFPEEEAFEMMVSIIQKNKLDSLFDVNLSKIKKINNIQIELFKFVIPDVLNHLIQNNIDISIYAISELLAIFMSKIDTFELDIDYVINESLKIYKKYHCQNYKKKLD